MTSHHSAKRSFPHSRKPLPASVQESLSNLSEAVSITQISEMVQADKSILMSLIHAEGGDSRSITTLRHELIKAAELNQSLMLENIRLKSRIQMEVKS